MGFIILPLDGVVPDSSRKRIIAYTALKNACMATGDLHFSNAVDIDVAFANGLDELRGIT
jgi:hypothetical protein